MKEESTYCAYHEVVIEAGSISFDFYGRCDCEESPVAALLRLCILSVWDRPVYLDLYEKAAGVWSRREKEFDVVLGHYIPEHFKKWAREYVSRQGAENNAFTLADDFPVSWGIWQIRQSGAADSGGASVPRKGSRGRARSPVTRRRNERQGRRAVAQRSHGGRRLRTPRETNL
jgi:hypothetical protein